MSKMIGLKAIALLAVFCIVFSGFSKPGHAAALADIPSSAETEINYLIKKHVINGYPDGTFRPTQAVTRAEAAIMLGKALNLSGWKRTTPFKDVAASSVASGYIASAASKGIINGYSDGTFRPGDPITRGQMALLLQRAFNLTEKSDIYFKDIPASGPEYEAINTIATAGLASGYHDGRFAPQDSVTRQDFAVFVARGLNKDFRVEAPEPEPKPEPAPEPKPEPKPEPAPEPKPEPKPEPAPSGNTDVNGEVTADSLNVRSGPSNTAPIIGTLPDGAVVAVHSFSGYWAKINYNNQTGYVHKTYLKLKNTNGNPLQNRIIVIDPGHGGLSEKGILDQGTSKNNLKEKDVTLEVANRVTAKLRAAGANVVQTRTGDVNEKFLLNDRTKIAYDNKAEIFVSIHVNAAPQSPSANGAETYYNTSKNANGSESAKLAQEIQSQLVAVAGMNDRKIKDSGFFVIKEQNIPSVLVELGFITNESDFAKLASPEYYELFAQAIYQGIYNYYNK